MRLVFRRVDGTIHVFRNGRFIAGGFPTQLLAFRWYLRNEA